jgi:hypothetical protein
MLVAHQDVHILNTVVVRAEHVVQPQRCKRGVHAIDNVVGLGCVDGGGRKGEGCQGYVSVVKRVKVP